jgi:hypothetical protein
VHFVEELKESAVGDLRWVVGYLEGFCVCVVLVGEFILYCLDRQEID